MTKQEKIDAIYKVIADKTLNFGCIIRVQDGGYDEIINEVTIYAQGDDILEYSLGDEQTRILYIRSIIGHPVLIGDVIEYIRLKNIWDINPITDEWDYPRLPIEEQGDECIEFVYNLIKK